MAADEKSDRIGGLKAGLPITLAYFFVAVGIGAHAAANGMSPLQAAVMSLSNLTSAGEISAITIFGEGGGYAELLLAQVAINLRYALMAVSLSQKSFSANFTTSCRFAAAHGITDEVFATLNARCEPITPAFCFFLILGPAAAWTSGTFLGAVAGQIIPSRASGAMSALIYAMLIALFAPQAKKSRPVLFAVVLSAAINSFLRVFASALPSGYALIISAVASAALAAALFPMDHGDWDTNANADGAPKGTDE